MSRLPRVARLAEAAGRVRRLARPAVLRLAAGALLSALPASDDERLAAAVAWLRRAHDHGAGGVAATFDLASGWQPPYPETSGYIVATLLHHADLHGDDDSRQRAESVGEWLLSQQRPDGSYLGGPHMRAERSYVFDTGQVLHGLLALLEATGDRRYEPAAERAAAWLAASQDDDGCWRSHSVSSEPHAYDVRVAWALARAGRLLDEPGWSAAGARTARWAWSQQTPDGWIPHMAFHAGDPPLTHTVGYTVEGLLEWAISADEVGGPAWQAGAAALGALRRSYHLRSSGLRLRRDGRLAGTVREGWTSSDRWSCVTGSLQIGLCAHRLAAFSGDGGMAEFGDRLIDSAVLSQPLGRGAGPAHGGVPGSAPLWGPYGSFRYINWGTKFLADALLGRGRPRLPRERLG